MEAPIGNESAVFIRNNDPNFAILYATTGDLFAYYTGTGDDADLIFTLDGVEVSTLTVWEATPGNLIISFIDDSAGGGSAAILALFPNAYDFSGEPIPLDMSIGMSTEVTSVEKRLHRRKDRPRIYFDQTATISFGWHPISNMFTAMFHGDVNELDARHGAQGTVDATPLITSNPKNTCFELRNSFLETRDFLIRAVEGKLLGSWKVWNLQDACVSSCSTTVTIDDLNEETVEFYASRFNTVQLDDSGVSTEFPAGTDVWGA